MTKKDLLDLTVLQLETESNRRRECPLWQLKLVAQGYGIHWLMFDPLLTTEAKDRLCFVQGEKFTDVSQWSDEKPVQFKHVHLARLLRLFRETHRETRDEVQTRLTRLWEAPLKQHSRRHYGKGAEYANPRERLAGTEDVAIVRLTLRTNGSSTDWDQSSSDWHRHPGDELMLVLRGRIQVHLKDSGIRADLKQGDFIHFYAEQLHGAINIASANENGDGVAQVLVIRFLQLDSLGTRYQFHSELKDAMKKQKAESQGKKKKESPIPRELANRICLELSRTLLPFKLQAVQSRADREVVDPLGLGRLLQSIADEKGLTPKRLVESAEERGWDYDDNAFTRIRQGVARVLERHLIQLAKLFDNVYPVVLYHYLHPVFRPVIQVRNPEQKDGDEDWDIVPDKFINMDGIRYWVPKRRLADSDMSIALLEIGPRKRIASHRHRGFELAVPLCGSVSVIVDNDEHPVAYGTHVYAHYNSDRSHEIVNTTDKIARLLIVRFYGGPRHARTKS